MRNITARLERFATRFHYYVAAIAIMAAFELHARAQDHPSHDTTPQHQEMMMENQYNANTLLRVVRQATERFKDVRVAEAEGYALQFGCVTGPDFGVMGLHYVNAALVNSGVLDPIHPQIVIYEPTPGGGLRLTGADFLVLADTWNSMHSDPPQLMGQLFHLFESPNRFGLPAFYTLHVWAWKQNPNGPFVNWHPNVSCQSFSSQ